MARTRSPLVPRLTSEQHAQLKARPASREIAWREKLAWSLKEKCGTVLTAAEVRDLVAEFDAMCEERAELLAKKGVRR